MVVEGANKAKTRKGKDFVRIDFDDGSSQFSSACFEESLVTQFLDWAQNNESVLLDVELDAPNPGEPPRLTVRGARPLSQISGTTAMILRADVTTIQALHDLKLELATGDNAPGEVMLRLFTADHDEVHVRLGRNFILNGELAERLQEVDGLENVILEPQRSSARLKLVA